MPNYPPDLPEVIRRLEKRIASLERTATSQQGQTVNTGSPLDITGLNLQTYAVLNSFGMGSSNVVGTWNAVTFDPDDITAPEVDRYEYGWRYASIADWQGAFSTTDTTALLLGLPMNVSIVFRVRVRTKDGRYGPFATSTITTGSDTGAPPQPSQPSLSSRLGTLRVFWDGLTSTAGQMPADFDRVDVHVSTSGTGFTPDATTLVGAFGPGGGYFTYSNVNIGTMYFVKMIAYDRANNASPTTTAEFLTIRPIVDIDFAPDLRINLTEKTYISFADGQVLEGFQYVSGTNSLIYWDINALPGESGGAVAMTGGTTRYEFGPFIPVDGTALVRLRVRLRATTVGTGNIFIGWVGYAANKTTRVNAAGSDLVTGQYYHVVEGLTPPTSFTDYEGFSQGLGGTTGTTGTANNPQTPGTFHPNTKFIRPYFIIGNAGSGQVVQIAKLEIEFDRYPNNVIGTAQINDLAVTNAKIGSMSVGKLTTGTLNSDITVSARIKTADTGARVELNSGGLTAHDSTGAQTFSVAGASGNTMVAGQHRTGLGANNIVMDADLFAGRPGIRFDTGSSAQLEPVAYSMGAGATGYPAGTFVINGREATTNSSGRGDLVIEHAAAKIRLAQLYGTNDQIGIEKDGAFLRLFGRHPGSAGGAKELMLQGASHIGTVAGNSVYTGSVSYGLAGIAGRRLWLSPYGDNASGMHVHVTAQSNTGFSWRLGNIGATQVTNAGFNWMSVLL